MIDAGRGALGLRRRGGRRIRLPVPRPRPRLLLALIALALALGGGWLWFRGSSLVAVERVSVTGVSGPDAGAIRHALTTAALNMTTLDVSTSQLRTAVAPYPVVRNLDVSTQFPHGMRIHVIEQVPVAEVVVGGQAIVVAADGTLLHDASGAPSLPRIPVRVPPGGGRLTGAALDAVAVLSAAPSRMLARISQVTTSDKHGSIAQLRNGPSIYFGDDQQLAAKWSAAIAVLGDPRSAGALYIDVSDPHLPAAGGGGSPANTPASTTTTGATPVTTTPASTTPVGSTTVPPAG